MCIMGLLINSDSTFCDSVLHHACRHSRLHNLFLHQQSLTDSNHVVHENFIRNTLHSMIKSNLIKRARRLRRKIRRKMQPPRIERMERIERPYCQVTVIDEAISKVSLSYAQRSLIHELQETQVDQIMSGLCETMEQCVYQVVHNIQYLSHQFWV
jgi:hypothetical protein